MNINLNPNSELNQSIVNVPDVVQVPDVWVNEARQFRMAMMMYACAIREVKTKLEVLNDELSIKNQRNPIEMIKSRVKKPMSILEKLQRRGLEVSVASMTKNLDDVAGIRIICSFVDDIYEVAEMLVRQVIKLCSAGIISHKLLCLFYQHLGHCLPFGYILYLQVPGKPDTQSRNKYHYDPADHQCFGYQEIAKDRYACRDPEINRST